MLSLKTASALRFTAGLIGADLVLLLGFIFLTQGKGEGKLALPRAFLASGSLQISFESVANG